MKTFEHYNATKPGVEQGMDVAHKTVIAKTEAMGGLSGNELTQKLGKLVSLSFRGSEYNSAAFNETKDNSGTVAIAANGLLLTCGNGANNDTTIISKRAFTPLINRLVKAVAVVSVSTATNVGLSFGIVPTAVANGEVFGADPVDGIWLSKSKSAGTVAGYIAENGNANSASSTLLTMVADTQYAIGFEFKLGATYLTNGVPTVPTATDSYANWIIGTFDSTTGEVTWTKTAFTSAQMTKLLLYFNTLVPTTQSVLVGIRANDTSSPTGTLSACIVEMDR